MTCEHIDYNNLRDCQNECAVQCMCCGAKMCTDHGTGNCQFGGMGFIEID